MQTVQTTWKEYLGRFPGLGDPVAAAVSRAADMLIDTFESGGILLVCGNGGSASDAGHMVGELVKAFRRRRPLPADLAERLISVETGGLGRDLASRLDRGVPVLSLSAHAELCSAIANDTGADYIFAQQVVAWGRPGHCLLGISTSGRSRNVVAAAVAARAAGMKVIGLTGPDPADLGRLADVCIPAPGSETALIQDAHRPIIHALCMAIEDTLFAE